MSRPDLSEREKRALKSLFLASTTKHGAKFCSVGVTYKMSVVRFFDFVKTSASGLF
jgi:hypothetical protein